jgi:hypothetical protein
LSLCCKPQVGIVNDLIPAKTDLVLWPEIIMASLPGVPELTTLRTAVLRKT